MDPEAEFSSSSVSITSVAPITLSCLTQISQTTNPFLMTRGITS